MRSINLIPPDRLARQETRAKLRQWGLRLTVSFLTMAAGYGLVDGAIRARVREIEKLAERFERLERELASAERLLTERDRLYRRLEAVHRIRGRRPVVNVLKVVGDSMSDDSYLVFVGLERPLASIGADPSGSMRLRGRTPDHAKLGEIMTQLSASQAFHDVKLVSTGSQRGAEEKREVEFELQCLLRKEISDG